MSKRERERRAIARLIERQRRAAKRREERWVARVSSPHVYLVLSLGMPGRSWPPDPTDVLEPIRRVGARLGVEIRVVRLTEQPARKGGMPEDADRWAIRFPGARRDDEAANRMVDRLKMIEAVNGMLWHEIGVLAVPERFIGKAGRLGVARAARYAAEEDQALGAEVEAREKLKLCVRTGAENVLYLWTSLPALYDEKVERAASFLYESHERAWFANSTRWDMWREGPPEDVRPSTATEAARLESAAVSAFKVVEALIGNVKPQDVTRGLMRERLDPSRKMPFPPHRALGDELENLARARDARAAHGSGSRKSVVTYYEVMGWQVCAQYLMNQVLTRGSSIRAELLELIRRRARV